MYEAIKRYVLIIITAFVLLSFYSLPKSVVAYNTRNLTPVSEAVREDVLKVAQEK
ncbi:MAG TPA: hypothetical protein GXX35_09230 [Thermoanaerobacterales bacterium]|nr:hypothetical protein [Thermoanaerobacterales bacterium]